MKVSWILATISFIFVDNLLICETAVGLSDNNTTTPSTTSNSDNDIISDSSSGQLIFEDILNNSSRADIFYYDYESQRDDVPSNAPPEIYPDPEKIYLKTKRTFDDQDKKEKNDIHSVNCLTENDSGSNDESQGVDKDLKGHDFIDNIMYIYYGTNGTMRRAVGGNVIVIGAVMALAAQILSIFLSILRNRRLRRRNTLYPVVIKLLIMMFLSNFIFIIGVQASRNIMKCEMTAILLHYLHLSTAVWGFVYIYIIYEFVTTDNINSNIRYHDTIAFGAPAIYVMFSFVVSSDSYEIRDYCWMSVQRGMIINYMVPVSILIVVTTVLGTLSLRALAVKQNQRFSESIESIIESATKCENINSSILQMEKCCEENSDKICEENIRKLEFYDSKFDLGALSLADLSIQSSSEVQDYSDFKRAIRFSLFFQPLFSINWFLAVVALENRSSCIMPIIFIISYNIMNWGLLIRSSHICPFVNVTIGVDMGINDRITHCNNISDNNAFEEVNNHQASCTDTIPLLCSSTLNTTATPGSANINNSHGHVDNYVSSQVTRSTCWETNLENTSNIDCISTISN